MGLEDNLKQLLDEQKLVNPVTGRVGKKRGRKSMPPEKRNKLLTVSLEVEVYDWVYNKPIRVSGYVNALLKSEMQIEKRVQKLAERRNRYEISKKGYKNEKSEDFFKYEEKKEGESSEE